MAFELAIGISCAPKVKSVEITVRCWDNTDVYHRTKSRHHHPQTPHSGLGINFHVKMRTTSLRTLFSRCNAEQRGMFQELRLHASATMSDEKLLQDSDKVNKSPFFRHDADKGRTPQVQRSSTLTCNVDCYEKQPSLWPEFFAFILALGPAFAMRNNALSLCLASKMDSFCQLLLYICRPALAFAHSSQYIHIIAWLLQRSESLHRNARESR